MTYINHTPANSKSSLIAYEVGPVAEEFVNLTIFEAFKKLSAEERKPFSSIMNRKEVIEKFATCLCVRNLTNKISNARLIGCSVTVLALLCTMVASGCFKDFPTDDQTSLNHLTLCSPEAFKLRHYWLLPGLITAAIIVPIECFYNALVNHAKEDLKSAIAGRKIEQI